MGKKTKMIEVAKRYEGYNYKHFTEAFGGGCWPWCAATVSVIGKESGNADCIPWSTSCNAQIDEFKRDGRWLGVTKDIRVGDILYYDWDRIAESRPADHVGIVIDVSSDTVKVFEGNKGDADSDQTRAGIRTITKSYPYIFGIARPDYDEADYEEKTITVSGVRQLGRGTTGKDVEAMQAILIAKGYSCGTYGSDGDFGSMTEAALCNFQTDSKLDVDGICGPATWQALLKK